jgi:SAM-dependent methyltransferase
MTTGNLSPEKVMQLTGGAQATAVVGTAAELLVFTRLEAGAMTPDELATAVKISPRGARVLLDALLALELVSLSAGRYSNAPVSSAFLVEGKPGSLAGLARVSLHGMANWTKFKDGVTTGKPVAAELTDTPDLPFWHVLVPAIAPLAMPAAHAVVQRLDIARKGPIRILDVGGGSGIFSAVLLGANREAKATQVDWPTVNGIAREFVAKHGVVDRFATVDGDIHTTDWGNGFDVAIYSNIAHQESPAQNIAAFRKFRAALQPGGTLVISDFIARDDRSGPPHALLFAGTMMLATREGSTWREADYRAWLAEAGFKTVSFEPTQGPSPLVYATG